MPNRRVDLEEAREIIRKYHELDSVDVRAVDLYEGGELVDVPQGIKDEWRFIGMGFCFYIQCGFYKGEEEGSQ